MVLEVRKFRHPPGLTFYFSCTLVSNSHKGCGMMKRTRLIASILGLVLLGHGFPVGAADLSIGVIEPQKVLDATKAGRKIKDALADYVNTRQRLIESEEQDIKALEEDLVKQGADLSPEAKQEKEGAIRQKLMTYRRHVQELEGEVQTKKRELLSDFTTRVEQVVREIAERENITLVVEKEDAGPGGLIMFNEPSINLTDRVIKAIESKGEK
jgi:outer membrane protein